MNFREIDKHNSERIDKDLNRPDRLGAVARFLRHREKAGLSDWFEAEYNRGTIRPDDIIYAVAQTLGEDILTAAFTLAMNTENSQSVCQKEILKNIGNYVEFVNKQVDNGEVEVGISVNGQPYDFRKDMTT